MIGDDDENTQQTNEPEPDRDTPPPDVEWVINTKEISPKKGQKILNEDD